MNIYNFIIYASHFLCSKESKKLIISKESKKFLISKEIITKDEKNRSNLDFNERKQHKNLNNDKCIHFGNIPFQNQSFGSDIYNRQNNYLVINNSENNLKNDSCIDNGTNYNIIKDKTGFFGNKTKDNFDLIDKLKILSENLEKSIFQIVKNTSDNYFSLLNEFVSNLSSSLSHEILNLNNFYYKNIENLMSINYSLEMINLKNSIITSNNGILQSILATINFIKIGNEIYVTTLADTSPAFILIVVYDLTTISGLLQTINSLNTALELIVNQSFAQSLPASLFDATQILNNSHLNLQNELRKINVDINTKKKELIIISFTSILNYASKTFYTFNTEMINEINTKINHYEVSVFKTILKTLS
ncbi:hypothetical protein GVAV_002147 [Gurleya vavrai]